MCIYLRQHVHMKQSKITKPAKKTIQKYEKKKTTTTTKTNY